MRQLKVLLIHKNAGVLKIIEGFLTKNLNIKLICIHLRNNSNFTFNVLREVYNIQPDVIVLGDNCSPYQLEKSLLEQESEEKKLKLIYVGRCTECWMLEKELFWLPIYETRLGYDVYYILQDLADEIKKAIH